MLTNLPVPYDFCVGVPIISRILFTQKKALVGAFSVIVQLHRLIVYSTSRQWVTSNQCTPAPITSPLSTLPCPVSSSQLTGLFSALLYLPPITCPAICLIKWETEKCLQSISADQVSAGCISSHIPYIVILQLAQSIYIRVKLITETRRQQVINCLSEWGSRKLRNVV